MNAVVAIVFLIMISVVAVGIIWGTVIPFIQGNLDLESRNVDLVVVTEDGHTVYDPIEGYAFVQIRRGQDEASLHGMEILINFEGTSYKTTLKSIPSNSARRYLFDLTNMRDAGHVPGSVSVAPVFLLDAREILGEITSHVKMPIATIAGNVPDIIIELNTDGDETTFPIPIIEGEHEQDFTDCPAGKTMDPWGGCAVEAGSVNSVFAFTTQTFFDFEDDVSSDWAGDHYVKFKGDTCVLIEEDCDLIVDVEDGTSPNELNFVTINSGDKLTNTNWAETCSPTDWFYVYDNPACG